MKNDSQRFGTALKQDPGNVQLLIETARYFINSKNPGKFLDLFEHIYKQKEIALLPPQIIFSIGQTALQNQRWNLACELLGILQKKDRYSPPLISPLSEALIKSGRLSEAKRVLEEAIHGQPKPDPELLTNFAITLSETGDYDFAEQVYRQVVETRPNEFLGHYNLGGFLRQLGRDHEAIQCYEACLKIAPDAPEAKNQIDAIKGEAERHIDQAIYTSKTENAILSEIYNSIEQKNWNQALSQIKANGDQLDNIRKHAAILELPQSVQNQISNADLYDPHLQVRRTQLFEPDDQILQEIFALIKNEDSLIWNRAGKPTREGFQSHEILTNPTKNSNLDCLLERLIRAVSTHRCYAIESLTGNWSNPISLSGWAVVLKNGGYQKRHIHPEAKFSGVFYVKVPSIPKNTAANQGDLCFFGSADTKPLKLGPRQGSVVTFPSYIPHETIPLINIDERICIAFNVQ